MHHVANAVVPLNDYELQKVKIFKQKGECAHIFGGMEYLRIRSYRGNGVSHNTNTEHTQ